MAVSDTKSKLIGLYQLRINTVDFVSLQRKQVPFDKCIDKSGFMTISTSLIGKSTQNGAAT
jgi:hypothetical protein